ncbi:MAG: hypothetical protein MZV63_43820 [Marinilabiliales bacterium]|nr:hypothetical protein [Marinilabiliales bacterium]
MITLSLLGTQNTNWQKEIFRTAISQDHNLSLSGAVKSFPYRFSVGYTDQNGILKNTDMQRFTGTLNLNPTFLNDDLKVNLNVKGMNTHHNYGSDGAIGSAVNMDPDTGDHGRQSCFSRVLPVGQLRCQPRNSQPC